MHSLKFKKKLKIAHRINQAFAFNSGIRANRTIQRTLDKDQKRLHVPMVDRTPVEAPPIVIAVVGPPGVRLFFFQLEMAQASIDWKDYFNSITCEELYKS